MFLNVFKQTFHTSHVHIIQKVKYVLGHVHIISYRFLFRFTKLYGMMRTKFPFNIYVEYEFKNFEHYFNVFWWKKQPFEKKNKRKYSKSNNKRMWKVLKTDFVLSDDEIQFLHSLANSNFGYCSRSTLLISPFLELSKCINSIKWIHKIYNYITANCLLDDPFFHYYQ